MCELGNLDNIKEAHKGYVDPSERERGEQRLTSHILWSDPVTSSGVRTSHRGLGILFGPEATQVSAGPLYMFD